MATFTNLSFETAGAAPGEASGWTATVVSSAEEHVDFSGGGGAAPRPLESFELGWGADAFAYTLTTAEFATYDSALVTPATTVETFSRWSGSAPFLYDLASAEALLFTGGGELDSFDTGWGVTAFKTSFSPGDVSALPLESFELVGYKTSFSPGDTAYASFDGDNAETIEDFEETFLAFTFTVAPGPAAVFTATAHGRANGDVFYPSSTGSLPPELDANTRLYIRDRATNTFKVSLSPGGAALDITGAGSGTHTAHGDPTLYWITFLN